MQHAHPFSFFVLAFSSISGTRCTDPRVPARLGIGRLSGDALGRETVGVILYPPEVLPGRTLVVSLFLLGSGQGGSDAGVSLVGDCGFSVTTSGSTGGEGSGKAPIFARSLSSSVLKSRLSLSNCPCNMRLAWVGNIC